MKCLARWDDLSRLLTHLKERGHALHGPRLKDGALVIDEIGSLDDLPAGWTDIQEPGSYRLRRHPENLAFGWHPGAESWKGLLLPSQSIVWEARRTTSGWEALPSRDDIPAIAFLGMRGCDVAGMLRLDRVFGLRGGPLNTAELQPSVCVDPVYAARRERAFFVGIQCIEAGGNCFCSSVGPGPRIGAGCDLVLTELPGEGGSSFLMEALSRAGAEILDALALPGARERDIRRAVRLVDACASSMPRFLDTSGIRELLERQWENRRWEETAGRCFTCGNCTMVCPTCFCSNILDETDLEGLTARRPRVWDSCFNLEFTYVHGGGNVRSSAKSRYRQWMAHKLATWFDQFGEMGCVGCGRCITWCPAGIDITEEAAVIRRSDGAHAPSAEEKCHVRP